MTAVKMLWGPATIGWVVSFSSALSGTALTDADNAVAWCFNVPVSGSITDVGFLVTSRTGSPPSYNLGVVTQDANGRPTTTAYGGSAITAYNVTSTGWKWVTLSTPATATVGDFVAVQIYPTGTAPDASNYIGVNSAALGGPGLALSYTNAWNDSAGGPLMAIRYDDGSVFGNAITSSTVHTLLRSDSTPDEAGCKFTVPADMTVTGARVGVNSSWGASATATITLYDDSDNVLGQTAIGDKDYVDVASWFDVYFNSVNLRAGGTYRLTVAAGVAGASGNTYLQHYTFESTTSSAAWPCGDAWQYTSRTDGGTWTDVSADLAYMGLWVSGIEFTSQYAYSG